jgi:pyrroline-5-carboxylate reductase
MKIAVIGGGRMGSSLAKGLLASGVLPNHAITVTCSTPERASLSASDLGVRHADSNPEAASRSDVIVLSVKPAKALAVIADMKTELEGKLLVSMVAGIRSEDLSNAAGPSCRIVRVMPNTAIRLLEGMTAISPHSSASPDDVRLTAKIFKAVGNVELVPESLLDVVTAISGSGPAFALLMLESMVTKGMALGLDEGQARRFAAGAFSAAADLIVQTEDSPRTLREEITSPGGTTAAGLKVLEEGGFFTLVAGAVSAAAERSSELSSASR